MAKFENRITWRGPLYQYLSALLRKPSGARAPSALSSSYSPDLDLTYYLVKLS